MISIHQSQFLPWVPYFYKILRSSVFVILDDVQFQKNGVQNRNLIKTPQGKQWFTVPSKVKLGTPIKEIELASTNVYTKLSKTLEINYKRGQYFEAVFGTIDNVFSKKLKNLNELNINLINNILGCLKVDRDIRFSSDINTVGVKDEMLIETIKSIGDSEYLSGSGALNYMDLDKFKRAGIKVYIYTFTYKKYPQLWNKKVGFVPDLSIIDLLFNDLEKAKNYITENGNIEKIC